LVRQTNMSQTINPENTRAVIPRIAAGDPDHPWSAARENRLEDIQSWALGGWFLVTVGCLLFARPWIWALGITVAATFATVWILCWSGAAAEKMLTNKPRGGTSNIGEWFKHSSDSSAIVCACGAHVAWIPCERTNVNCVLRDSVVCSCGRGHYKITDLVKRLQL
jgi:hypothetical protein